jgi:hypothetical protein
MTSLIKLHRMTRLGNDMLSDKINGAAKLPSRSNTAKNTRFVEVEIQNLLWNSDLVELLDDNIEFDMSLRFTSQKDFADYLIKQFGGEENTKKYLNDPYVMNWLSLVFLDVVTVNSKKDDIFVIGESSRYLLGDTYHKRHLIRTPLWITCYAAGEFCLKYTSPTQISDIVDLYLGKRWKPEEYS